MSEIRYGRVTLPECCEVLAERVSEPFRGSLKRISSRMRGDAGLSFGTVFAGEMGQALEALPIARTERELFLGAMGQKGFAETRMQLRTLGRVRDELERMRGAAAAELREKCRMAVGLGGMGGLLLVILLL